MKRILIGAVVGALIAYTWSAFSYMALPWHNLDFNRFADDQAVTRVLVEQADLNGIYFIPNIPSLDGNASPEAEAQWQQHINRGPFAYMWILKEGLKFNMGYSMLIQFLTQLIVGLIVSFLLWKSSVTSLLGRAFIVALSVSIGSFMTLIPFWNWYGFPATSTIVTIVDYFIAWFLAGLVLAKVVPKADQQ